MRSLILLLALLLPSSLFAQSEFQVALSDATPPAEAKAEVTAQEIEVREAKSSFHRELIRAAVRARRAGDISRADVIRLRVAMISPAFRDYAEDLAVLQMSASGSENVPIGEDGRVDRGKIDWESIGEFLKVLVPLILQIIDALSQLDIDASQFLVDHLDQLNLQMFDFEVI